ncbi:fungal-specific transcription factor domain-containing protein [Aspergillus terricola var. indicus]
MPSSSGDQRSDISCHACRKRKVKCDRTYPHCLVCEQTDNTCTYPAGPLKPGPKIGSLRTRKRARATVDNGLEPPAGAAVAWLEEGEYASDIHSGSCVPDGQGASTVLVGASVQNGSTTAETKALDLSFILHPSHVSSPPNKEATEPARHCPGSVQTTQLAMQRAHTVLGVTLEEAEQLTMIYFDKMTTISLFHQPSFPEKLARITSAAQMAALLAAMFAFAVRFRPEEADVNKQAARFLNVALQQIDEALDECGDGTPPLCLLQACVLAAHCQLTQGVLGRAWRTLGSCVRLAYEMNLHLVDVQGPRHAVAGLDVAKWCSDEEQRRAWWAIWEMDVFATTIRRTPTAIDWSQIEILLPVDDEHWFQCQPQESCFFEPDPIRRWKVLESCGNQSPKAWFIVINSLMKEAQRISSPRGIPSRSQSDQVDEARHQLEIIANAIRCFQLALPDHLRYKNQDLTFDARGTRRVNSAVYNIHMMTHLARLMVYRYDVFKGRVRVLLPSHDHHDHHDSSSGMREGEHAAVREYFDAADNILAIIQRSSADHIQYTMPFLSSTIWLASAVQLMRSQLCRPGTLKSVVKSRYEVLHLTYKKCVRFWDMHPAVQQSLETLEEQLEACKQAESTTSAPARRPDSTDPAPAFPSPAQSHIVAPPSDWQSETGPGGGMVNEGSMLDSIALQSMGCQPLPSQFLSSATLVDPMFLFGTNMPSVDFTRLWELGPQAEWATTRLDMQGLPD